MNVKKVKNLQGGCLYTDKADSKVRTNVSSVRSSSNRLRDSLGNAKPVDNKLTKNSSTGIYILNK
jgi:hypothetical protein